MKHVVVIVGWGCITVFAMSILAGLAAYCTTLTRRPTTSRLVPPLAERAAVDAATELPAPSPRPAPTFMSDRDAAEYARRCEIARLECMYQHPAYSRDDCDPFGIPRPEIEP